MNLKQAVVFAILMENNEGIKNKSPNYIMEKLKACSNMDNPESLLDMSNKAKLQSWNKLWCAELDVIE